MFQALLSAEDAALNKADKILGFRNHLLRSWR